MLDREVYDIGECFRNKYNGLLNDCHWNVVGASFFAWKKNFRNFSDLILDCTVEEY